MTNLELFEAGGAIGVLVLVGHQGDARRHGSVCLRETQTEAVESLEERIALRIALVHLAPVVVGLENGVNDLSQHALQALKDRAAKAAGLEHPKADIRDVLGSNGF